MKLFRVFKSQNVSEVESELERLFNERPQDIQLPVTVTSAAIGGEAALIQLIITWAKNSPTGRLITHVQNAEDAQVQLDRLIHTGFGFVACLMAKDILNIHTTDSLSQIAYGIASERVDKMFRGPSEAAHGHRVLLASVDQSTKWCLAPFYFSNGQVRGRKEFRHLVESLLTVRAKPRQLEHVSSATIHSLGTILHELFRNTHDWARTDVSGVPIRRSVRGILVESRNLDLAAIGKAADGSQALETFVSHDELKGSDSRFRCLEISIFDSGPGLAARWLGRPLDATIGIDEEYSACMECLQKHRSSSSHAHAGVGLYEVVRTLSPLKALMRLRTGHLAVYRDFITRPLQETERQGAADLDDWETATTTLKEKPPVEGTLFTMIIPLGIAGG